MCIKLPSIIINSGEPAGIGLDLCVFLAFKKFPAKITIMGNKEALIRRAKLHKKKIHFTKKKTSISGPPRRRLHVIRRSHLVSISHDPL